MGSLNLDFSKKVSIVGNVFVEEGKGYYWIMDVMFAKLPQKIRTDSRLKQKYFALREMALMDLEAAGQDMAEKVARSLEESGHGTRMVDKNKNKIY